LPALLVSRKSRRNQRDVCLLGGGVQATKPTNLLRLCSHLLAALEPARESWRVGSTENARPVCGHGQSEPVSGPSAPNGYPHFPSPPQRPQSVAPQASTRRDHQTDLDNRCVRSLRKAFLYRTSPKFIPMSIACCCLGFPPGRIHWHRRAGLLGYKGTDRPLWVLRGLRQKYLS